MYFGKRNSDFAKQIYIHSFNCKSYTACNCHEIERTKNMKDLGIIIDERLKWDDHIKNLSKVAIRVYSILLRIKPMIPQKTIKTLYHSLFSSITSYGILVWGAAYYTKKRLLYKLQDNLMKKLFYYKIDFPILNLDQQLIYKTISYYIRNRDKYRIQESSHDLRSNSIIINTPKSQLFRHSPDYLVTKIVSRLSPELLRYNKINLNNKIKVKKWSDQQNIKALIEEHTVYFRPQ